MTRFSADSKLGDIIKDPEARAVYDRIKPGASEDPRAKFAGFMTIRAMARFSKAGISPEMLEELDKELKALG